MSQTLYVVDVVDFAGDAYVHSVWTREADAVAAARAWVGGHATADAHVLEQRDDDDDGYSVVLNMEGDLDVWATVTRHTLDDAAGVERARAAHVRDAVARHIREQHADGQ